jgi:hypothetical protein
LARILNKHNGKVSFGDLVELAPGVNDVPDEVLLKLAEKPTQEQNKAGYADAVAFYFKNGTLVDLDADGAEDLIAPAPKAKRGRPAKAPKSDAPPAPDAPESTPEA